MLSDQNIPSCKFSRDSEGWLRGARASTSSNQLILLSKLSLTCMPNSSDHGKIYTRKYSVAQTTPRGDRWVSLENRKYVEIAGLRIESGSVRQKIE